MSTLFLLNDSLSTTVITSLAYSEFAMVTEMFPDKQMGNWPVNLYCYNRFVKLRMLKGKSSSNKSQQC